MSGHPPEPDPFSREGARSGDGLGSEPTPEPTAYPPTNYPPPTVQGQPYGTFGAPPLRKSPFAIASLILGILGTVSVCGITGPAAVGLGIAALKQIDTMPETFTGRRLAIAGIVTGAFGTLWMLFWVVIAFGTSG